MSWIKQRPHIVAYAIIALIAIIGIYRVETLADTNRRYMCNFVTDLRTRYEAGQQYQNDVIRGERPIIPGLNIADLQRSLDSQKATLDSFRGLDCSD